MTSPLSYGTDIEVNMDSPVKRLAVCITVQYKRRQTKQTTDQYATKSSNCFPKALVTRHKTLLQTYATVYLKGQSERTHDRDGEK